MPKAKAELVIAKLNMKAVVVLNKNDFCILAW